MRLVLLPHIDTGVMENNSTLLEIIDIPTAIGVNGTRYTIVREIIVNNIA